MTLLQVPNSCIADGHHSSLETSRALLFVRDCANIAMFGARLMCLLQWCLQSSCTDTTGHIILRKQGSCSYRHLELLFLWRGSASARCFVLFDKAVQPPIRAQDAVHEAKNTVATVDTLMMIVMHENTRQEGQPISRMIMHLQECDHPQPHPKHNQGGLEYHHGCHNDTHEGIHHKLQRMDIHRFQARRRMIRMMFGVDVFIQPLVAVQ
jgi:hypothetical protein